MTVYDNSGQPLERAEGVERALKRGLFATSEEAEAAWDRMVAEFDRMLDQADRADGKSIDEVFDPLIAKYKAMAAKRAA